MYSKLLLDGFKEMIDHEKRAKAFYEHYIEELEDEDIAGELDAIRKDEIMHIKLIEQLIEQVS